MHFDNDIIVIVRTEMKIRLAVCQRVPLLCLSKHYKVIFKQQCVRMRRYLIKYYSPTVYDPTLIHFVFGILISVHFKLHTYVFVPTLNSRLF